MAKSSGNWWSCGFLNLSGIEGFFGSKNKANDGPFLDVCGCVNNIKDEVWKITPKPVQQILSESENNASGIFGCVDGRSKGLKKDASTQTEPQTQTQPLKKSVSFGPDTKGCSR